MSHMLRWKSASTMHNTRYGVVIESMDLSLCIVEYVINWGN